MGPRLTGNVRFPPIVDIRRVCDASAMVGRIGVAAMSLVALSVGTSSLAMPLKWMADGKLWTAQNLNLNVAGSFCYQDAEANCDRYGRLYTWKSALVACRSLGPKWRLPTESDWRELARQYGGVSEDSRDGGRKAYAALSIDGRSGFNALLAGGRVNGNFDRLGAHGFYWTQSESVPDGAWFYNFAKGNRALYRQSAGDEEMAIAVRCVKG